MHLPCKKSKKLQMYFLNIDVFSEDEGDGDVESHKAYCILDEAGVKILAFLSCPLVLH